MYLRLLIVLGLTNVMAGYRDIDRLTLRAGAVKHAINVVSENCQKQNILISSIRAAVYGALYKESAHTLSIITKTPQLNEGDKLKQVVGYNKKSVLMCDDNKQNNTETLRATIKPTDDECTNFIESTDGFVFSASNYEAMNPEMQKQFLHTAVEAISKEMLKEELIQDCICIFIDSFRARTFCITKERKEPTRQRK